MRTLGFRRGVSFSDAPQRPPGKPPPTRPPCRGEAADLGAGRPRSGRCRSPGPAEDGRLFSRLATLRHTAQSGGWWRRLTDDWDAWLFVAADRPGLAGEAGAGRELNPPG